MKLKITCFIWGLFFFTNCISVANASVSWDWSFGEEAGQFITSGNAFAPGEYTFEDFSVTNSAFGSALGSVSGGEYFAGSFSDPVSFVWDGTRISQWISTKPILEPTWIFTDTQNYIYTFGWGQTTFDVDRALLLDATGVEGVPEARLSSGVTTVSAVPVPAAVWLFGSGLVGFLGVREKR